MLLWMHYFFYCIYDVCLNDFFFLWENAFMKFVCICNVCLNDVFYFMKKCIYEILDFLFLKMHLWMYDFFLNAYIMYVWMIFFMEFWTFSFWKCIYECMIFFNAYIMYVWMIFLWENAFMKFLTFSFWKCIYECMIFFECIYNVCMNDFFMRKYIYEDVIFF